MVSVRLEVTLPTVLHTDLLHLLCSEGPSECHHCFCFAFRALNNPSRHVAVPRRDGSQQAGCFGCAMRICALLFFHWFPQRRRNRAGGKNSLTSPSPQLPRDSSLYCSYLWLLPAEWLLSLLHSFKSQTAASNPQHTTAASSHSHLVPAECSESSVD